MSHCFSTFWTAAHPEARNANSSTHLAAPHLPLSPNQRQSAIHTNHNQLQHDLTHPHPLHTTTSSSSRRDPTSSSSSKMATTTQLVCAQHRLSNPWISARPQRKSLLLVALPDHAPAPASSRHVVCRSAAIGAGAAAAPQQPQPARKLTSHHAYVSTAPAAACIFTSLSWPEQQISVPSLLCSC